MIRTSIPSLLFRQTLILALIAGACTAQAPSVGAGLFVLLVFVPDYEGRKKFLVRVLKLLAVFLLGFALMRASLPEVPAKPSWASVPRQAVLVEGLVDSVKGLPGGRVRLLLSNLKQAELSGEEDSGRAEIIRKAMRVPRFASPESGRKSYAGELFHDDAAELPGLAALTLSAKQIEHCGRPTAGQKIEALVRLFPSGGSRNAADNGASAYWAAREVWHNARLVFHRSEPLLLRFAEGEGSSYALSVKRERWRAGMENMLAGRSERDSAEQASAPLFPASQGRAMLTALLFGDRSALSLRTVDLFTRAGLVHSLALSGQHLALAALAGMLFIALLSACMPKLYRFGPKRTLVACAGLPFALCYLFLGGAPFSLVRAAFMLAAGVVFLCLRRTTAPLDALFAAVLLLFLAWPLAVLDLSAQLSVLAVAGILLSLPLLSILHERLDIRFDEPLPRRTGKKVVRAVLAMLVVSLAAQLAVLPVLVSAFGAVSLCFWLNVVWLPPLTFITLPLAALGFVVFMMFGPQPLSVWLFDAAAWPADLMLAFLEWLDMQNLLPFIQCFRPAPLSALGYGAGLAALALMAQAKLSGRGISRAVKRLFCFGLFFMLAGQAPQWLDDLQARFEERVSLTMIDVGAGQAVLLEYPGGRILVDGGGNTTPFFDCGRSIAAPKLTERRLPHLDAVFVSHCDVDHARGLRWILEHFRVDALYWSSISAHRAESGEGRALREIATRRGIPEKVLRKGDVLELGGGLKLEVVAPDVEECADSKYSKLSSNDASLGLRLVRNGHGLALLCGDMHAPVLHRLAVSGAPLKSDVLVLPHHGSASSFQKLFYTAVSPRLALASAASYNHYGFPSRKVRAEMERRGIPVLSTSELGTFSIRWKRKGEDSLLDFPEQRP